MNSQFNLVEDRWIPCIRRDGRPDELGLRDVLVQAQGLLEVSGESPLVVAALYRLLLAVLHRVFGPKSMGDWATLWEEGRWDGSALEQYLRQWEEWFDLFHPDRPFGQAAHSGAKAKSVNSLVHHVASGNAATLFDHHTDDRSVALSPAAAARFLVASQAFGIGGLSGLPEKFTDAPCAKGVLFLVQGDTLFETLALNLLRYPDNDVMRSTPEDCPAWEMEDPFTPPRTIPLGYLDYLTWQNRRILFQPETVFGETVVRYMTWGPGLRLDEGVHDPMKHYTEDPKQGPRPLSFREGRALWRDSAVLFRLGKEGFRPPRALGWVHDLMYQGYLGENVQVERILALGMAKDRAKVEFYRSEQWPLPLVYLQREELVDALEQALEMAENVSRRLWGAARTLATFLLAPEADRPEARQPNREGLDQVMGPWNVERRYWSRLEIPFRITMERLPDDRDAVLSAWQDTLRRTAWEAFDGVTENLGVTPQALKATVRGRDQLAAGLAKALPAAGEK